MSQAFHTAPGESASDSGPRIYSSRALELIRERLEARTRCHVLDLGPAIGDNIEFLGRYRCKLYIEDCAEPPGAAGDAVGEPVAGHGLRSVNAPASIDVVLAWDLFDYLSPSALSRLGRGLSKVCKPHALLFTLVHTGKQIPARPSRYLLLGDDRIGYSVLDQETRGCPQHHQASLLRHLPGFRLLRSMLLRNGSQEYVFQFG